MKGLCKRANCQSPTLKVPWMKEAPIPSACTVGVTFGSKNVWSPGQGGWAVWGWGWKFGSLRAGHPAKEIDVEVRGGGESGSLRAGHPAKEIAVEVSGEQSGWDPHDIAGGIRRQKRLLMKRH